MTAADSGPGPDDPWRIDTIEIRGGFLAEFTLRLPAGLTCVIGPRGSGKSTLAEAIRWAVAGHENAGKPRLDLYRANLQRAAVTVRTTARRDGQGFVVRREARQPRPLLTNLAGTPLTSVDLDRGTFLPLDAYSSFEIEEIADEALGPRRRALLDELRPRQMQELTDRLAEATRQLQANADAIRARRRTLADLAEQIQALGDPALRVQQLPPPAAKSAPDLQRLQQSSAQEERNKAERSAMRAVRETLARWRREVEQLRGAVRGPFPNRADPASANHALVAELDAAFAEARRVVADGTDAILAGLAAQERSLADMDARLTEAQAGQQVTHVSLQERNQAVSRAVRERAQAEADVRQLGEFESLRAAAERERQELLAERQRLRAHYLELCDSMSLAREEVAREIMRHSGEHVRIVVRRQADALEYQQKVGAGLHGAAVRGHDAIVATLAKLRPDELAQIIAGRSLDDLDAHCGFGPERARKVLDALVQAIDPLDLDVLALDDVISIELDVARSGAAPLYKDASQLSRGQKCTALLPLLLARRRAPLIIDQPEDNLDNHFIFRTVVEALPRLKQARQMIFVTHNANIPVLGDADLVVVLGSDGKTGFIEKQGTVDECQQEIIDLLEGGKEAFDQRRRRYERP